tara:strand:- start:1706 stop:1885 length:180 start_codon:yes stop_codon:yes gene_type:complete
MIFEFNLLNLDERMPVLNGNFDVKIEDHERIVAFAELIVFEKNVPFFIIDEILELGCIS